MDHSFKESKSSSVYSVQYDVQFDNSDDYSSSSEENTIEKIEAEWFYESEEESESYINESKFNKHPKDNGFSNSYYPPEIK